MTDHRPVQFRSRGIRSRITRRGMLAGMASLLGASAARAAASLPPVNLSPLSLALAGGGAGNPWQLCATRQNSMTNDATRVGGTNGDKGRFIRVSHVACGNIEALRLKYSNTYNNGTGEAANTNTVDFVSLIEYPLGTVYPVYFNGKQIDAVDGGATTLSDPLAIFIPKGATFYERTDATVALPPTITSGGTASGGSLAAATYYYKATTMTDQGESGPSTELSIATSASGQNTILLSDFQFMTPPRSYNLYRSTATGSEVLLATLPAGTKSFVDNGTLTAGSATPPAAQLVPQGCQLSTTVNGGNEGQILQYGSTPALMTAASPGFVSVVTPVWSACAIYGIGSGIPPSVAMVGDSIMSGTGDTGYGGRGANDCGFAVRALDAALIPHISVSQGGETLANFQGLTRKNRGARIIGCKYVICNYGTNSLAGQSLAQMQASALEIAGFIISCGSNLYWCTLNPKTTSTDNTWTTVGSQAPLNTTDAIDATYNNQEARRVAFNTWLRDPSSAGFVAQSGASGVFDTAALVEVNGSNVLTVNGGLYICAAAQNVANYGTIDGTHPSTLAHILMSNAIAVASLR